MHQDDSARGKLVAVKECREIEVARQEIEMHMAAGVVPPTSSPDNWHPGIVKVYGQVAEEEGQREPRLRIVLRYEFR